MSWQDGFAILDRAIGGQTTFSGGYKPYKPPSGGFGTAQPSGSRINWSDLASGRMATSRPTVVARVTGEVL